ncbi:uncharacterized protein MONBRDRAFT_24952 [Monosiga brevicollis MX1]|uniref:Uncharacterized protein n=1 Tax=Monosiga brevicollis TaxID=81824 RepID=A9UY84_MONBE|nr:uncharacterized protein MONBRDRAFT_24952 [Monosiga brevicollis MX1]EDQ89980.1 predicted protein [Monosiga brevicollis MX1]|eukprot:XP_001745402.1 hypothetical protein [Monosiga brevicollis MX1]
MPWRHSLFLLTFAMACSDCTAVTVEAERDQLQVQVARLEQQQKQQTRMTSSTRGLQRTLLTPPSRAALSHNSLFTQDADGTRVLSASVAMHDPQTLLRRNQQLMNENLQLRDEVVRLREENKDLLLFAKVCPRLHSWVVGRLGRLCLALLLLCALMILLVCKPQ